MIASLAWKRLQVGLLRSPLTRLDYLTANRWRSLCAENRLVYTHKKIVQKSLLATTFFPDTRLKKWTRTLWQRHWCVTAMYLHVWMSEWTLIILSVWVLYLAVKLIGDIKIKVKIENRNSAINYVEINFKICHPQWSK